MKLRAVLIFISLFTIFSFWYVTRDNATKVNEGQEEIKKSKLNLLRFANPTPAISPTPSPIPSSHTIAGGAHIYQTFNNCGPAAMSMALSYFGDYRSQAELGAILRPWQNPQGVNDDKSVTLEEMAILAEQFGYRAYHRPAGTIEFLKRMVANDIPVITRTWLRDNEDIGHYRVIKGYEGDVIIQDDSLQGASLRYTSEEFEILWRKFGYEYLVIVTQEKDAIARQILGEHVDQNYSWQSAEEQARQSLKSNPTDVTARFNLIVALAMNGKYPEAVKEFELIRDKLSQRTLWYQIEPFEVYLATGRYQELLDESQKILNGGNLAYSELHLLRARAYEALGKYNLAKLALADSRKYNNRSEIVRMQAEQIEQRLR